MRPLVSILLPAYNAAPTLPTALRSLARQTETRWQCVIVDDGSTDGTLAWAHRFAAGDSRVCVISSEHRGIVHALNIGLERCDGRYVARMDADDVMHRRRLAEQTAALDRSPHLAAVGCHVRLFPRAPLREGRRAYERWLNAIDSEQCVRREAFVECPIAHPTLAIRTEELKRLGYRDAGWPEDYDLVLRLLASGSEVGVVAKRLVQWRDAPGRLSRTSPTYSLESFTECKAAFLARGFLAATDSYVLWGYGSTGKSLHRALARRGKSLSHVVDLHPGRLGKTIHGGPVIPPPQLRRVRHRPIVVSVAGEGPRAEIREELLAMGFVELRDFVCAA